MFQAAPARPDQVTTLWREPFALGSPHIDVWPAGLTVAEIVARADCLPSDFAEIGVVTIDGEPVPRALWPHVRPKPPATAGRTVHLTFHAPVREGGRGGKQILAVVAAIALSFATAGIATAGIPSLGIAAGSLGAKLIATSVGIVGSLVIAAVTAPPTRGAEGAQAEAGSVTLEPAAVSGNVLQPNASVPRVIGTRRVYPPFACQPIVEYVGQDEIAEAVHVLAGPHRLRDIRLGETTWDGPAEGEEDGETTSGLEVEIREGTAGEAPLSLVRRIGRTDDLGVQMSVHAVDPENQLVATGKLPVWHGMASIDGPDEVWIHFVVAGLLRQDALTDRLRVPLRLRMRRRGESAWRHLPELHYMDNTQAQRRVQVKLLFGEALAGSPIPPPSSRGFVEARKSTPAQTLTPVGGGWQADAYFSGGAGGDVLRADTVGTAKVRNVNLQADQVTVYLDRAEWPAGVYEIEAVRGATFRDAAFTSDTYLHSGAVWDFFASHSGRTLPLTRAGLLDTITLRRAVSIQNRLPVSRRDVALIAIRARNRSVGQLSALASGLVRELGGYAAPLEPPPTFPPVSQIVTGAYSKAADIAFECDVRLPVAPDPLSVLWEDGGAVLGAAVHVDDAARLVIRAGRGDAGVQETGADTVVFRAPVGMLPFDGGIHRVAWDIRVNPGRVRLWIDGVLIGEEATVGGGALWTGAWGGAEWGGYLRSAQPAGGSFAGVATGAAWWSDPADAGALRAWPGRLHDASGQSFSVLAPSRNPAPWLLEALTGRYNADPVPQEIVDLAGIAEWRRACFEADHTCDMVAEGESLADLLRIVASCGYARPYQSEIWGVIRDRDRSAEAPVQVFSPRNMRSFQWTKAFARVPAGFRVSYRDASLGDKERQINVYRAGAIGTDTRIEQVSYEGLAEESKAVARALFDLAQARHRSTFYDFTAPAEALRCRRGSLVAVSHDILTRHSGAARIVEVLLTAGKVTTIGLDAEIDIKDSPDMLSVADMLGVADMLEVGLRTGIAIRRADGSVTVHTPSNAPGPSSILTFSPGLEAKDLVTGCLLVAGTLGREYRRLIVTEIRNGKDLTAQLTLVDEAPQIWEAVHG